MSTCPVCGANPADFADTVERLLEVLRKRLHAVTCAIEALELIHQKHGDFPVAEETRQ